MANLAPKVGDLVHYVLRPGLHLPAFVLENARRQSDPLQLFVVCTPTTDVRWAKTVNLDSYPASLKFFSMVMHVPAGQDALGTWHWPEHRAKPSLLVGEAGEEPS